MKPDDILAYCLKTLTGTILIESWGERGIFYNPNRTLKRGTYVLTVKEKDGANDKSSHLNRQGIYRVNLGLKKPPSKACSALSPPVPQQAELLRCPMTSPQQTAYCRILCTLGWGGSAFSIHPHQPSAN